MRKRAQRERNEMPYPTRPATIIENARKDAYRAAMQYWALAGQYDTQEVVKFFDDNIGCYETLDLVPYNPSPWTTFFETYPIELPRDEFGKVDIEGEFFREFGDNWQRALITSQAAEVMRDCALGGGDDTWFDYLPNGIKLLEALQSEEWALVIKDYVDNVTSLDREDDEDARDDMEETMAERWGFFMQDCTSPLVGYYMM